MHALAKLLVETRLAQGALPGLLVEIEHAALVTCVDGRVELVDGRRDAPELEDAREDRATEAPSDDRDGG
jgi:hypothetical protein